MIIWDQDCGPLLCSRRVAVQQCRKYSMMRKERCEGGAKECAHDQKTWFTWAVKKTIKVQPTMTRIEVVRVHCVAICWRHFPIFFFFLSPDGSPRVGFILAFAPSFHNKQQFLKLSLHRFIINNLFVKLLFLHVHRETDRFFAASGVHLAKTQHIMFHYRHAAFSAQLKRKVGLTLVKETDLRITLNLDGSSIISKSHSPITLVNFSSINLVSIFRYSSSSSNPVYTRHVDSSSLGFTLESYRQSYIDLVCSSRFID